MGYSGFLGDPPHICVRGPRKRCTSTEAGMAIWHTHTKPYIYNSCPLNMQPAVNGYNVSRSDTAAFCFLDGERDGASLMATLTIDGPEVSGPISSNPLFCAFTPDCAFTPELSRPCK